MDREAGLFQQGWEREGGAAGWSRNLALAMNEITLSAFRRAKSGSCIHLCMIVMYVYVFNVFDMKIAPHDAGLALGIAIAAMQQPPPTTHNEGKKRVLKL